MKKLTFILLCTLFTLSGSAERNDSYVIIKGQFVQEMPVQYEVYNLDASNLGTREKIATATKAFTIKLRLGGNYMLRFTSSKGQVKYLRLDVRKKLYLLLTIDFSKENSGYLLYNGVKNYQMNGLYMPSRNYHFIES
jgi:hypothetical protein